MGLVEIMKTFKLEKFCDFFHDGNITNIGFEPTEININMKSAFIDQDEFEEKIPLNKDSCLEGVLKISVPKKIIENGIDITDISKKTYDHGNIFDLEIKKNTLSLSVEWIDFTDESFVDKGFSTYEVIFKSYEWIPRK